MSKPKDRGKTKSLDDLLRKRPAKMPIRRGKQGLTERTQRPRNSFPFVPARPDRENRFGLNLDKWDCRIANGVQEHGFRPVKEFCVLVKVPVPKFYECLGHPDLIKALHLLGVGSRVLGYAKAMSTLSENFDKSPKWAELYLKANAAISEAENPVEKKEEGFEDRETIKSRLQKYLTYKKEA